jgi:histidinol-phosphate aminotransferase
MIVSSVLPKVPQEILDLVPYDPGKPVEELEREMGISGAIKLASNENPLGPAPGAVEAITKMLPNIHRYPDGAGYALRKALADKYHLDMGQVALGNGSDEIIEMLTRAFIRPGEEALAAKPSFLMYSKLVQVSGGNLIEVPLKDFQIDLEAMLEAITPKTRLVFVNSPNNPAGSAVSKDDLSLFLDNVPRGVLVVLDEAYIDFVSDPDVADGLDFLDHSTPVVVMRTFSKSYGLAGMRIGYAFASEEIIAIFNRVRPPFNTSILAQAGALGALDDQEFLARTVELTHQGLEEFYACFKQLGLYYVPSQTNYVLVRLGDNAPRVNQELMKRGVIVRSMASYDMAEFLRVSVGLPEENTRFCNTLRDILQEAV